MSGPILWGVVVPSLSPKPLLIISTSYNLKLFMAKFFKQFCLVVFLLTLFLGARFAHPQTAKALGLDESIVCNVYSVTKLVFNTDGPWYFQNICQFNDKVFNSPEDEIFGERYTFAQINWIANSLMNLIPGPNIFYLPLNVLLDFFQFLPISNSGPGLQNFAQLGVVGLSMGTIAEMYRTPPASAIGYFGHLAEKLNLVPTAHAQGYGYTQINALLSLWEATRDVAYLFMTLCLIVAGFLVIFRVKINPQTAITVQMLIPRIVTTLLLVTFSYAIAGFVIDLIYLVLTLAIKVLMGSGTVGNTAVTMFTSGYYITTFMFLITIGLGAVALILTPIGGPIIALIIFIAIIFTIAKTVWMLIKSYVNILLAIVLGPLQIMMGLVPNIGGGKITVGFGNWMKGLLANAAVFVVVPLMLLLVLYFWNPLNLLSTIPGLNSVTGLITDAINFILNTFGADPGVLQLGAFSGNLPTLPGVVPAGGSFFLVFMMGWGILALIPKSAEIIREAVKASAFKYGTALAEPLTSPYGMYQRFQSSQAEREKTTGSEQFLGRGITEQFRRETAKSQARAQTQSSQSRGET